MLSPAFAPQNYKNSVAGQHEQRVEDKINKIINKIKSLFKKGK